LPFFQLFLVFAIAAGVGALAIDWNDEVFAQSALTHDGQVRHEPTAKLI